MYTRGQFAIIGKVGRKALRLYEENGLLIPAVKRDDNGYSYYSTEQIEELYRIKEYRRFGLSIKEIKQIVTGETDENTALVQRGFQLEHEIQGSMSVKMQLEQYVSGQKEDAAKDYEIKNKIFEERNILFRKENLEVEYLGVSVGKLYELAAKNKLIITASHYVRYDNIFEKDGQFSMETCLPVTEIKLMKREFIRKEEAATCIYTMHKAGFSTIGKAHQKIKEYALSQDVELTGKVFEVYNRDFTAEVYYEIGTL